MAPRPAGPNNVGDKYVRDNGQPMVCTHAGTPGTWEVDWKQLKGVVSDILTGTTPATTSLNVPYAGDVSYGWFVEIEQVAGKWVPANFGDPVSDQNLHFQALWNPVGGLFEFISLGIAMRSRPYRIVIYKMVSDESDYLLAYHNAIVGGSGTAAIGDHAPYNHIEHSVGSNITLDTTSTYVAGTHNQPSVGRFVIKGNTGLYRVRFAVFAAHSTGGYTVMGLYRTHVIPGTISEARASAERAGGLGAGMSGTGVAIIRPDSDWTMEIRVLTASLSNNFHQSNIGRSWLEIERIGS